MSRIVVLGHFADGLPQVDGQIVRTRLVRSELIRRLESCHVTSVDTKGISRKPFLTLASIILELSRSNDAIIMPGERGLKWLLPIYLSLMKRYRFRLHFLVVGGWLPSYLAGRRKDIKRLSACTTIHVQTDRMLSELKVLGLRNLSLLPNFRSFPSDRRLSCSQEVPLRLVYLSRVMPQKGIETAIKAVTLINNNPDCPSISLDIWGPVPDKYSNWFKILMQDCNPMIIYRGVLEPESIPDVLPDYGMMVFPTTYAGEGFPGVIVDAFVSGLPVIASDWQDNGDFIRHGVNGLLFTSGDACDLASKLCWALSHPHSIASMARSAASMAENYHVDTVFPGLIKKLGFDTPVSSVDLTF